MRRANLPLLPSIVVSEIVKYLPLLRLICTRKKAKAIAMGLVNTPNSIRFTILSVLFFDYVVFALSNGIDKANSAGCAREWFR